MIKYNGSLKDKIDNKQQIDHETTFNWSLDIIHGLNYLHLNKIIHGTLKPKYILNKILIKIQLNIIYIFL